MVIGGTLLASTAPSAPDESSRQTISASSETKSTFDVQQFVEYFYLDPQPDRVRDAMVELSKANQLSTPSVEAIRAAFFGALFTKYPDRVENWTDGLNALPIADQRVIWRALFISGTESSRAVMRKLAQSSDAESKAMLERLLAATPPDYFQHAVTSPQAVDMLLAMYSATGEQRYIAIVADALRPGSTATLQIDEMERTVSEHVKKALADCAFKHSRVLEACRRERLRLNEEVREYMDEIIASVEMRLGMEGSPEPKPGGESKAAPTN